MRTFFLSGIGDISLQDWQSLWSSDYPFTRYEFLHALEVSGSVCEATGWQPMHLVVEHNDCPVAVVPLYQKTHSYGEYVFDWAWADAYQRAGLDYYPKLINAVPFTPATGPRIAFASELGDAQKVETVKLIVDTLKQVLGDKGGSGFHCLFPEAGLRDLLARESLIERQGCQFHWFNNGYRDFDDFLSRFNSRKRKSLKRERQKVREQDLHLQMRSATEVSADEWEMFYALYHRTYFKRSGRQGYLNNAFFKQVVETMPEQIMLASAHHQSLDKEMLAAALYFRDSTTLYGRYWGTQLDVDGLHFETCYYQGIEYAIAEGLARFDPGAQGEHKIQRGFTPVKTCSYHWVAHPAFSDAVVHFCDEEKNHTDAYCQDGRNYLPFREGEKIFPDNALLEYQNEA